MPWMPRPPAPRRWIAPIPTDYDLVVLDLMLPDMDGLQVLAKIRNRKVGPPVLILSARGGLDDRVKGLEQGATTTW